MEQRRSAEGSETALPLLAATGRYPWIRRTPPCNQRQLPGAASTWRSRPGAELGERLLWGSFVLRCAGGLSRSLH